MELQEEAIHMVCLVVFFNLANIFAVEVGNYEKGLFFQKCLFFSWTPKNKTGTDFTKFKKGLNNEALKNTLQFLGLIKCSQLIQNICNSGFFFCFSTPKNG